MRRPTLHQLVLYGLGSATCFAMALATERAAAAAPFVSRVHAVPVPPHTRMFDQKTVGGQDLGDGRHCTARTRILLSSELPVGALRAHYARHRVAAHQGEDSVAGTVRPASGVNDLVPRWQRHRKDLNIFVVEYVSPGTPNTADVCR